MKNSVLDFGNLPECVHISFDIRNQLVHLLDTYQSKLELNIACIISDINGTITYANDRYCEISKFSKEELIGSHVSLIQSHYHSQVYYDKIFLQISSGKSWKGMMNCITKDGNDYWRDTLIVPVMDEDNIITEYLSLRLPVDNSMYMVENSKLIKEMLFNISHKLRKPVTQISSVSAYLSNEDISQEEFRDLVDYMRSAADSIDSYTRELNEVLSRLK